MKITQVNTTVVKIPHHDRFAGQRTRLATFPASDYYFEEEWQEVYSQNIESLLVRVDTDEGLHGWGECQAPIVPEAAQAIVARLLGPMLLGKDPLQTDQLFEQMCASMNVRGHSTGFMRDAIAGVDIALWDIKGKAMEQSIGSLLAAGAEPLRTRLPLYVSGLRADTPQAKAELAEACFDEGYAAVKVYLGRGVEKDIRIAETLWRQLDDQGRLLSDLLWSYRLPDAMQLCRVLQDCRFEWIEAPLAVEDIEGHARLARALDVAVAAGEALRSHHQFATWMERGAMRIVQPDVARCGITGARDVARLARQHGLPVAFHVGVCLGIAVAATWQLAAATPNYYLQEHQPPPFELSNRFFHEKLEVCRGQAVVPDRPGLGVDVVVETLKRQMRTSR